jgi:hypothetical protein
MIASRSILIAIGGLALVVNAPPQSSAHRTYREVVGAYRRSPNVAIDRVLTFTEAELAAAIDDVTRGQSNSGWPASDLVAAAMLHTGAAVRLIEHPPGPAVDHLNRAETPAYAASDRSPEYAWFEREWSSIAIMLFDLAGSAIRASEVAERAAIRRGQGWDASPRSRSNRRCGSTSTRTTRPRRCTASRASPTS